MEWKLFKGDVAQVSTFHYHRDRERADHLGDPAHRGRIDKALQMIVRAILKEDPKEGQKLRLVDLGCGDGGLLSLIIDEGWGRFLDAQGYDFAPANIIAASGVRDLNNITFLDVFPTYGSPVCEGILEPTPVDIAVATEVIEHLSRPHEVLKHMFPRVKWLVCSSPWNETDKSYSDCHAWAWNMEGYVKLLQDAGFTIIELEPVTFSQVILAKGGRTD